VRNRRRPSAHFLPRLEDERLALEVAAGEAQYRFEEGEDALHRVHVKIDVSALEVGDVALAGAAHDRPGDDLSR
jgi:hypothetical protein